MVGINKFYDLALMAEVSYLLFDELFGDFSSDVVREALQKEEQFNGTLSATQAADFVTTWEVVSHQKNTDSGFSATVFKNKQTGEYVYATRGTESNSWSDLMETDIGDIVIDGLAIKQIVDMYNDWQRLNAAPGAAYQIATLDLLAAETTLLAASRALTPIPGAANPYEISLRERFDIIIDNPPGKVYTISKDSWAHEVFPDGDTRQYGAGIDFGGVAPTVVGHSLGGHLAVAFTRLFPSEAVTINGAGFMTGIVDGTSGNAEMNIANLFSMLGVGLEGASHLTVDNILNLYGENGIEMTSMSRVKLRLLHLIGGSSTNTNNEVHA